MYAENQPLQLRFWQVKAVYSIAAHIQGQALQLGGHLDKLGSKSFQTKLGAAAFEHPAGLPPQLFLPVSFVVTAKASWCLCCAMWCPHQIQLLVQSSHQAKGCLQPFCGRQLTREVSSFSGQEINPQVGHHAQTGWQPITEAAGPLCSHQVGCLCRAGCLSC